MVSKLGIVIKDLGHSQIAYDLLKSLETVVQNDLDIVIFCQNLTPITRPNLTAVMNIYDCWGYDGTLVATNLESANFISDMPGTNRRLFYVYDFEWIHNPNLFYKYQEAVKENEVITRTKEHAKIIKSCFNKESSFTLPQLDIGELWTKLNTKTT